MMLLLSISCSGAPFKIAPKVPVDPVTITNSTANDRLELRAAILNEDEVVDLFDGNLILAGIIPVRVVINNRTAQSVELSDVKFRLSSGKKKFDEKKAKDVLKQMVKYYGVRLYNPTAYDEMQTAFINYSLDVNKTIDSGETRQGLIFFKFIKEQPLPTGLNLEFKQGSQAALNLTLN